MGDTQTTRASSLARWSIRLITGRSPVQIRVGPPFSFSLVCSIENGGNVIFLNQSNPDKGKRQVIVVTSVLLMSATNFSVRIVVAGFLLIIISFHGKPGWPILFLIKV